MSETGNYVYSSIHSFSVFIVFICFSPRLFASAHPVNTRRHGCVFIFVNFTAVAELVLGALTATKIFYVSFGSQFLANNILE